MKSGRYILKKINSLFEFSQINRLKYIFLLIVASLLVLDSLTADVITLKSGKEIECILRSQTRNEILIMVNDRMESVRKRDVKRIKYGQLLDEKKKLEEKRKRLAAMRIEAEKIVREKARAVAEKEHLATQLREFEEQVKKEEAQEEAELSERRKMVNSIENELAEIAKEEEALEKLRKELTERDERLAKRKEEIEKLKAVMKRQESGVVGGLPSFWRSAMLPGWGQLYDNRELRGRAFQAGMLATGYYWLSKKNSREVARKDYITASRFFAAMPRDTALNSLAVMNFVQAQDAYSRMNASTKRANTISLILLGIYTYNLFDAYSFTSTGGGISEKSNLIKSGGMVHPTSGLNAINFGVQNKQQMFNFSCIWRF